MSEFINPLANSLCVFASEYEKFKKFTEEVTGLKELKEAMKEGTEDKKKEATATKKK